MAIINFVVGGPIYVASLLLKLIPTDISAGVSVLLTTVVVLFALFCHIMSVIATKWVVLG